VIRTTSLAKSFGGVVAVRDATVEILPGKINALIGPNGSGKTTFFNLVTGLIKPDSGAAFYRDVEISGKSPHRIAHLGVGRTFQLCRIFPRMSVLENMLVAVRRTRLRELLAGIHNAAEIERARHWLGRMGIEHLEAAEARDLSYGQQKLLELGAVLMAEPELVLLDEPAGGINPALIERLVTLIRELNAEGRTFLVVEHNMDMVMGMSDHVIVFDRGEPICAGPPRQVQADPRVLEAYLGV
jgi:neutral amino acid transport system ATP-binding protein